MNTPYMATEPGNDGGSPQDWPLLLGNLMLARMPSAAEWKQTLKACLASSESLSERTQEAAQQWSSAWHLRADTAGFIEYWRQCGETAQQLGKRLFDWQMQAAAQWQQQGYALLPQLLHARGEGDMVLVSCAAQQAARKQWDDQNGALMQWFSGISPAFLQCLQLWLEAGPESAGGERPDPAA
ncbi:hypothetical protein FAZ69_22240 [Trinickia terrae]|uniref:Uncharacterized protein n=1 Tax=Trinickia terrae TaxID=2571161 RepID=A0A4U1HZX8_9BURK|nr:hypothetical protein [Trinickia terrae]TKC86026.1 hypothetical protein FAZ69_22240 [Trinickia terrae]